MQHYQINHTDLCQISNASVNQNKKINQKKKGGGGAETFSTNPAKLLIFCLSPCGTFSSLNVLYVHHAIMCVCVCVNVGVLIYSAG